MSSTYTLELSKELVEKAISKGYDKVYIRQTCQRSFDTTHNNTNHAHLYDNQTTYILTCDRCKKDGGTPGTPIQYEIKFVTSDGDETSCGRSNTPGSGIAGPGEFQGNVSLGACSGLD